MQNLASNGLTKQHSSKKAAKQGVADVVKNVSVLRDPNVLSTKKLCRRELHTASPTPHMVVTDATLSYGFSDFVVSQRRSC
ncbi:hypothetical protein Hdeb2414_s0017g00507741 [Helianthus debilis subsp. tardiflorus]